MIFGLNFLELICRSANDTNNEYYYFTSSRMTRNPKQALNSGYAPDKMRIICEEREIEPVSIRRMWPHEYFIKKYFTDPIWRFKDGYRVDWQKIKYY